LKFLSLNCKIIYTNIEGENYEENKT